MAYGRVIVTAKGNVEHMEKTIRIGRREFSEKALLALLSGVAVTVSACGGGGDSASPSAPSAPNPPGDESGTISGNHGHVAEISAAQLATGAAVTLQIRGSANHPHSVDLSGGEVQSVAAGQRVSKSSSNDDGHTHTVTFN